MAEAAIEAREAVAPPLAIRYARWAGVVVMGVALGLGLLPAIFELISLADNITPFKYQNF